MEDGHKTPHGHPDFNSYLKILRVFIFWTDGGTDGDIHLLRVGWKNFFHCLRKVSPAHQRSTGVWYIVQEFYLEEPSGYPAHPGLTWRNLPGLPSTTRINSFLHQEFIFCTLIHVWRCRINYSYYSCAKKNRKETIKDL